jgi:hypothetical protein
MLSSKFTTGKKEGHQNINSRSANFSQGMLPVLLSVVYWEIVQQKQD